MRRCLAAPVPPALAVIAALALAGCGDAGPAGPDPDPGPVPVATVEVVPSTDTLSVGATRQLGATLRDASGAVLSGRTVAWTSSDEAVATVSATGLATAVAAGSAEITAAAEGRSATARLRVVDGPGGPVALVDPTTFDVGSAHACAIRADGAALCWGSNQYGNLGDGSGETQRAPVAVAGGHRFREIRIGARQTTQTCALTAEGRLFCWGSDSWGAIGAPGAEHPTPTAIHEGRSFAAVTAGGVHTCALTREGGAYCWGNASWGSTGTGRETVSRDSGWVAGGHVFRQIAAGDRHTCAVTPEGVAYCWGSNTYGQIGDGGDDDRREPVRVAGDHAFAYVTAGDFHSCALTSDGRAYCWGWNRYGELGDGTIERRAEPVAVAGGHRFATIQAANEYTCGLTDRGEAYCWGWNLSGRLGDGTSTNRSTPTRVSPDPGFVAIAAGRGTTCGLTAAGALHCWGANSQGQLGDGTTTPRPAPREVSGGHTFLVPRQLPQPPAMPAAVEWVGGAQAGPTAWNVPANWSGGAVPTPEQRVVIPATAHDPVLDADRQTAGLEVRAGAVLDLAGRALTVRGDVAAPGTVAGGALRMNASVATLSGNVPRLRVEGTVTLGGPTTARGGLLLGGGRLHQGAHRLTLVAGAGP